MKVWLPLSFLICALLCGGQRVLATDLVGPEAYSTKTRSFGGNTQNTPSDSLARPEDIQRVRIHVSLKPFRKITSKSPTGQAQEAHMASKPIVRTLRARLDRSNHFYVGDQGEWHLETVPMSWRPGVTKLGLRLLVSRTQDLDGTVEESLGTVEVHGDLIAKEAGMFEFSGSRKQQFRNKLGHPELEIIVQPALEPSGSISSLTK